MTGSRNFLAFDCGATSGRGVLATFEGDSFRMEEVYRFPSEMVRKDGHMYWDVLNKSALIYIAARNMGFEPDGMTDAQMQELSAVFGLPK